MHAPALNASSPSDLDCRRLSTERLEEAVRAQAFDLGFNVCRFTGADMATEHGDRLRIWLQDGAHGDMHWMRETAERRIAPRALWPEATSVVMLGLNYGPGLDPLASLTKPDCATISVYARNRDYHDLIKGRLKQLAGFMLRRAGAGDAKVFVDTAPVMEKPLAQRAGIGWQGKHTNLVSRDFGSWLFLGAIFTSLQLAPDPPERDHCGRLPGALSARCAALHFLPHHRAQGPYSARISRQDRQSHLWLRRLSRGLPLEQIRKHRTRGEARRARRIRLAAACAIGAAR